MILDDGTNTKTTLVLAIGKKHKRQEIAPLHVYLSHRTPVSLADVRRMFDEEKIGNNSWTYTIMTGEVCVQKDLFTKEIKLLSH